MDDRGIHSGPATPVALSGLSVGSQALKPGYRIEVQVSLPLTGARCAIRIAYDGSAANTTLANAEGVLTDLGTKAFVLPNNVIGYLFWALFDDAGVAVIGAANDYIYISEENIQ
jgi:hypothetical protein